MMNCIMTKPKSLVSRRPFRLVILSSLMLFLTFYATDLSYTSAWLLVSDLLPTN